VVLAVIAAKAKAISHAAAEVGHVLVLVAIAGASVTVAAGAVILGLVIRQRLRQIDGHVSAMQGTLNRFSAPRELPESKAELPAARADIPAKVFIHPPKNRVSR